MKKQTSGIHHITAVVGHPQENYDFYAKVLGLRMVKKTVNFDDPRTYHFYFGDKDARPGTIITFFPIEGAYKGKIGDGQVGVTTYLVPMGALDFWEKRLNIFNISFDRTRRFGEDYLAFEDVHGLKLELVERDGGEKNHWIVDDINSDVAIKGFGGAILFSGKAEETEKVLVETMGLEKISEEGEYIRFKAPAEIGNIVDLKITSSGRGLPGIGTVHHIAWSAKDREDQEEWLDYVWDNGFRSSEIRDRNYFTSIYFREKGGILFEIATDGPGFAVDEDFDKLGQELKLPSQYEELRESLQESLYQIKY